MTPLHDPPRLAFFVSGRGSNLIALLEAITNGALTATPAVVISNRASAGGLDEALQRGVPILVQHPAKYISPHDYATDLLRMLHHYEVDVLVLAGYLKQLPSEVIAEFAGRIINVHPALLPLHGGKGMYGHHVHQAVLDAGEAESGVTIHLVTEEYDEGPVLAQERVPVMAGDTAESLAARVLAVEHRLYAATLSTLLDSLK
ncbi:MAG: phosphoribosylglycinamide formyltransferase [bacterium]